MFFFINQCNSGLTDTKRPLPLKSDTKTSLNSMILDLLDLKEVIHTGPDMS